MGHTQDALRNISDLMGLVSVCVELVYFTRDLLSNTLGLLLEYGETVAKLTENIADLDAL